MGGERIFEVTSDNTLALERFALKCIIK